LILQFRISTRPCRPLPGQRRPVRIDGTQKHKVDALPHRHQAGKVRVQFGPQAEPTRFGKDRVPRIAVDERCTFDADIQRLLQGAVEDRVTCAIVEVRDKDGQGLQLLGHGVDFARDVQVDGKDQRHRQHADDGKIHAAPPERDDHGVGSIGLNLDAVLGDIEDPGQDDRDRQPDNGEDDDGLQSPFRGFESIEQDARDLDDDPGDANVEASRAEHLASSEFFD
jgi:hypothetical protein